MESIQVTRTVVDTKYKSRDGQIFDQKKDCEQHELQLDFDAFEFDTKKTQTYHPENIHHFLYKFITQFQKPEYREISMLFVKRQSVGYDFYVMGDSFDKTLENDVQFADRIRWDILSRFIADANIRAGRPSRNMYRDNHDLDEIKKVNLKSDLSLVECLQFLLGTGFITPDFLKLYFGVKKTAMKWYPSKEEQEKQFELNKVESERYANRFFFDMAFELDSTDGWKYLYDLGIFDVSIFFNDHTMKDRWITRDFVSGLLLNSPPAIFFERDWSTEKRCKWLRFILELDLDCVRFWKRKYNHLGVYLSDHHHQQPLTVKEGEFGHIQGGGDNSDIVIYQSVADVLSAPGYFGNESEISIFMDCVGENVKKNNLKTVCKPETKLADTVYKKIYDHFIKRTDLGKIDTDPEIFKIEILYHETYNNKKRRCVYFALSDINCTYRGLGDVCALYDQNHFGHNISKEKAILKLSEYLYKPDELFETISMYLTDGMPLEMDKINEIKKLESEVEEKRKKIEEIKKVK